MSADSELALKRRADVLIAAAERASADPVRSQHDLLAAILERNAATEFGKDHGFASIRDAADYASRVPQRSFEDLAPYMSRVRRGEQQVLTASRVVRFNVTSGTTAVPKYLPVTARGRLEAAKVACRWMGRICHTHPGVLSRSICVVCGEAREGMTASGVPFGSASGMLYEGLPRTLRPAFTLPFELSAIRDYELRCRVMARVALGRDLSLLVSPNPLTLLRLAEVGMDDPESIIRGINDGSLGWEWRSSSSLADTSLLASIEQGLRPDSARARELDHVFRRYGELRPAACWPQLQLIGCWLGGSVGTHAVRLDAHYGERLSARDIGYLASEGSMSVPLTDGTAAGLPALDSCYFEFVPAERDEGDSPSATLGCHELEEGKSYRVLLTNWNGLYRYAIDDIVNVRGRHGATPLIAFERKGAEFASMVGEKLHASQLAGVMDQLETACGVSVSCYRAIPDSASLRYDLLLRVEPEPSASDARERILPLLDRMLCDANIEYASKRRSHRLAKPRLFLMGEAWEAEVRREEVAVGRRDVQYKWRCFGDAVRDVDMRHVIQAIDP